MQLTKSSSRIFFLSAIAFNCLVHVGVAVDVDRFGLSMTCSDTDCENDRLICIDDESTDALCNITCLSDDSCAGASFVVANSGGLQLSCLGRRSCIDSTIEWVNSDNLENYTTLDSNATIGGALRKLECVNQNSCERMLIEGGKQQLDLDSEGVWTCEGAQSCRTAESTFRGTIAVDCTGDNSCDDFTLICLSGANCETYAESAQMADGAFMYCLQGTEVCNCTSDYFNCSLVYTPAPTSASDDDDKHGFLHFISNLGRIVTIVIGCVIILLIFVLATCMGYVYAEKCKTPTLDDLFTMNMAVDPRVRDAHEQGAAALKATTEATRVVPMRTATPGEDGLGALSSEASYAVTRI